MFAPAEVAVELSARWGRQDWAEWIARHTAPNPAFGYAEYGGRLWARGHLPGALHCYRQSVRLQPERAQSWYNLGLIEGQMGRDYPAGEAFRRVTELEPKNGGAWGNYSMSLARMGRLREAHEAAMRALELNPASPTARRVREVTAKQLGLE
jgi:tetratricopeptide (TPR) repeat protein